MIQARWGSEMGEFATSLLKWHPFAVVIAYAVLMSDYRRYLDSHLEYIAPPIPAAPEDILGFGFWVPWLIVALWFVVACTLSYQLGSQHKLAYWLPLLCIFGILSIADFWLYSVLERQVLAV
jgi:hypothetical protein